MDLGIIIGEATPLSWDRWKHVVDLVEQHGFASRYNSVKRFVRTLKRRDPERFDVLESTAGEEAQVDFGTGAPIVGSDGKRRKTHVFRIVLSHSRKGYSESTWARPAGCNNSNWTWKG